MANGVVYIGDDDTVDALNARTGAKLWGFATESVAAAPSPAVVDGVVYVSAGDNVFAFGLSGGGGGADLFLRIRPTLTTAHQGDLLTYALPGVEPRSRQR